MLPENIDDLFRDKLDGHATPPGDALWARLQAEPNAAPEPGADRLDHLFRQRLDSHATAPGRAVWERLEDEHLRPRKRRAGGWWPVALAAVIALLLVAGGAGLWSGRRISNGPGGAVASQQTRTAAPVVSAPVVASEQPAETELTHAAATGTQSASSPALATAAAPKTTGATATQKNTLPQATRSSELASTAPKASRTVAGQSARHLRGTNRQPDAATENRSQVARTTARPASAPTLPSAADEPRLTPEPSTIALAPKPVPTPEIVRNVPVPAATLAAASELITVDVRNGSAAPTRLAKTSITALAEAVAPTERRGLGGRLLQQAGNLARGERVSLAEITGLPENVTLRATVAGRSISKSIRL